MIPKFKFLNQSIDIELKENLDKQIVDNPIGIENLPDGQYMIRGNKPKTRKVYLHAFNNWYLIEDVLKDNGHYLCDAERYSLYPNLPEKEWDKLNSINRKYLTKYWKRALCGYNLHMELRRLHRDARKNFIKYESKKVMEEQFVTYEIALKLKELGFDEECIASYEEGFLNIDSFEFVTNSHWSEYEDCCSAPLWQQVIDWFRKKYRIYISINSCTYLGCDLFWYEIYQYDSSKIYKPELPESGYFTYNEAREEAILKAIELCQKINKI